MARTARILQAHGQYSVRQTAITFILIFIELIRVSG